ncbi:UNVERIFIED_CONTAM: hypothetical protein FKN15_010995 [Acipenser sinensis]
MSEEGQQSHLSTRKTKEKLSEELRVLTVEMINISYAINAIVEKVNAAGVTRRTVNQVMKM